MGNIDFSSLEKIGDLTLYNHTLPHEVEKRIEGAEVVITNKVRIEKKHIDGAKALKLICIAATGMNNVDLQAAETAGIPVRNVVNYSTESVAQFTIGLLLELVNNTGYYRQYMQGTDYAEQPLFTHIGPGFFELKDKVLGIIGLGNIGRRVAEMAGAFGMKVVYYSSSGEDRSKAYQRLELDDLLEQVDILSIHAPLNAHTEDLLTFSRLQQMKSTAYLINTGRGGIVNEDDLVKAIDQEVIAGAAVDVFTQEPLPLSHPYYQCEKKERLLLTPHIAWGSSASRQLLLERIVENIEEGV
ncbi:D-2-hydroxyacid dehydrogenase [Algivirga pacifica]|uniref:D-2-hydroxyacid dehydrogenase n=2 Tax=Algivirga pacifica TaxID=1162670 RepID=A0ABP9DFN0_9BACT